MNPEELKKILEQIKSGSCSIGQAVERLKDLPFEDIGFACVDHHRKLRRGLAEVIYCPGKTNEQIVGIFSSLAERGHNVLATRAGEDVFEAIEASGKFDGVRYERLARAVVLEQEKMDGSESVLPIVTAGTSDLGVAEEARVTAELMGQRTEVICDVGVAGIHRLAGHLDKLRKANVIIVVAGMDGALPGVVGGLVDCSVIAVPTSVGYGASFGGISALLTMLNSCSSGVSVVNIDNGFSAAVSATLINRRIEVKIREGLETRKNLKRGEREDG